MANGPESDNPSGRQGGPPSGGGSGPPSGRKSGKRGRKSGKKKGRKSGKRRRSSKKRRAGSGRGSGRRSGKRPPPSLSGPASPFPVICRECYEEFTLHPGSEADVVTCPVCGHGAKRPDEDLLARIGLLKGQEESTARLAAIGIAVFLAGVSVFYAGLAHTSGLFQEGAEQTGVWVLLANPWVGVGLAGLGAIGALIFAAKHEGKRVEIYF